LLTRVYMPVDSNICYLWPV